MRNLFAAVFVMAMFTVSSFAQADFRGRPVPGPGPGHGHDNVCYGAWSFSETSAQTHKSYAGMLDLNGNTGYIFGEVITNLRCGGDQVSFYRPNGNQNYDLYVGRDGSISGNYYSNGQPAGFLSGRRSR